ncbi:MAG TPA: FHA domain-containing protein [Paucimonas sp.]|nr:FHA domain-containing protein [Paucimonas sp.]
MNAKLSAGAAGMGAADLGAVRAGASQAGGAAPAARSAAPAVGVVLRPLSHPELGDIRIDGESLFAIGRTEPPFVSYALEAVADLSRRHARIFIESGVAYLADLGSKNGTAVNGVQLRERIGRLRDGDEVCFGKTLAYRVQIEAGVEGGGGAVAARLLSLTLSPEHGDLGLQPIVVTSFPFLISKTDTVFARYKEAHPHQVNYLSRRHAHIFLKDGRPFVEDLGSTNGTFLGGKRLDEHAAPLAEGDVLAFGGHHFVYRVGLRTEEAQDQPTVTRLNRPPRPEAPGAGGASDPAGADKTTFVAAPDSFLDIFCVDPAAGQEDEVNGEVQGPAPAAESERRRGRMGIFLAELAGALADGKRPGFERGMRWGMALLATLGLLALGGYLAGAPERNLKDLLARGDYAQAAQLASRYLEDDADDAIELGPLATEALLKSALPRWNAMLAARDFTGAGAVVAEMKRLGRRNPGVQPLVNELEWVGEVERFVVERGGADAPPKDAADEARTNALVAQWNEGAQAHQSAFAAISVHVPEFRDRYAETLSHLRKLALAGTGGWKDGGRQDGAGQTSPAPGDGGAGGP